MRRVETVRKSLWWQVESIYPSAGSFSLLLSVGMIFRDKEGIQAAVFKTNNRTMMWQGDLIVGLERASLQSHLLVLLWIFSARFKTLMEIPFPHKHFCFTQIWLSRSRPFLKLFSSTFSVRLSSTIDLLKDAFTELTTCRPRQVCWWRRFTQT